MLKVMKESHTRLRASGPSGRYTAVTRKGIKERKEQMHSGNMPSKHKEGGLARELASRTKTRF